MNLSKNINFVDLSHDIFLNGSQSFHDNILPEDYGLQYFIEYPYPIQSPCKKVHEEKIKSFRKKVQAIRQKEYAEREFKKMKHQICGQDFQNYAILPNFFLDYIGNNNRNVVDYGLNIPYSDGILEKFGHFNDVCLIRPSLDNNLMIYRPEYPEEKITLEWLPDKIINIQHLNSENCTKFMVRCENTIYLIEIDENFEMKIHIKFSCDIGYQASTCNDINKSELAIMDEKNKLKILNLETQTMNSTYNWKKLHISRKPKIIKLDYLDESTLILMTDKQIKLVDSRCASIPQDINIEIENCDMLLGFALNKNETCLPNTAFMSSKHSYFIYDIRMTAVDDFINHNLRSPPCYVNYIQEKETKLVTLYSQSASERVIFGRHSAYSLPYHMSTLEDTYDQCRSQKYTPLIPDIEQRLSYPVLGVQMLSKKEGVSIYTTNILGELFCQNITSNTSDFKEPVTRMYEWLIQLQDTYDPPLNIVHLANASAAFNIDCDINEVDLYEDYEKCNVNKFLQDETFDFDKWNAEGFLEIWGADEKNDFNSLIDPQPTTSKVEEWIVNTKFEVDQELVND